MIDVAASDNGDGFEAAVRVLRKPGDDVAVIHAPSVLAAEVLADLVAGERRVRPEAVVPLREVVDVVHAEQERVLRLPARGKGRHCDNGVGHFTTIAHTMSDPDITAESVRLDVWLDVACLFKTRSAAQKACTSGKIEVNGQGAKPHRLVRVGDAIEIGRPYGRK